MLRFYVKRFEICVYKGQETGEVEALNKFR